MTAEVEKPIGELQITTSGGSDLHRWIRANHDAYTRGFSAQPATSMPLGEYNFRGSALEAIAGGVGVSHEANKFDLQTQLYVRKKDEEFGNTMVIPMQEGAIGISMEEILGARSGPRFNLEWGKFVRRLKSLGRRNNFDVNKPEGSERSAELTMDGDKFTFEQAFVRPTRSELVLVSYLGAPDIPLEDFERVYEKMGKVTKFASDAANIAMRKPIEAAEFEMKPAGNTLAQAETLEKTISLHEVNSNMVDEVDEKGVKERLRTNMRVERPSIRFEDIAGLNKPKAELQVVVDALRYPDVFAEEGAYPPRGVLLYGEPGVGKTTLVKAMAGEADAAFLSLRVTDVIHHLMGRSERLINDAFKIAVEESPSILFIDEMDGLASNRHEAQHELTSKMVSTLISSMDWLSEQDANVTIIGATNRKDAIDPALTRAGRLDMIVEVPKPDDMGRAEGFALKMRDGEERANKQIFDPNLDMNELIRSSRGLTVADIEEVIRRILVDNARIRIAGGTPGLVSTDRILEKIASYEPSVRQKRSVVAWGQR